MEIIEMIAQDVFDKVRSRFKNLEMGDSSGAVVSDPTQARFFDFDFSIEDNIVGRISISINEPRTLKLFYGQGILETADSVTKSFWYDFLKEMRFFAKRRLMRFDTRDISKKNLDKEDFKFLATSGKTKSPMKESSSRKTRNFSMKKTNLVPENKMFGSSKSSYRLLEKTRLIVRHSRAVDEGVPGSRSRHINAIYVENEQGERWKCPINSLSLGEAMQRHVANGGRPYDSIGQAMVKMAEDIAQLSAFKKNARHVVNDSMHTEANEIMERTCAKLESLRDSLKKLSKQHYYESWTENFQPIENTSMELDQTTLEDLKTKFTVSSFSEDLTQYFPLIHSIMQETGTLNLESYTDIEQQEPQDELKNTDEFDEFETWVNDTDQPELSDDQKNQLKELLANDIPLGENGETAVLALQDIGIDDLSLVNSLKVLGKMNPEATAVPTIYAWLEKFNPEFASTINPNSAPTENNDLGESPKKSKLNNKEIAEMVFSFYDRENKTFPLGETGVLKKIENKLGDRAARLAEKLINNLSSTRKEEPTQQKINGEVEEDLSELQDVMRLSGIKK
jgi:hypothetical protein